MINLAFDARRAFNDLTGLGNYSRNLISIVSNSDFNCFLFGSENDSVRFDYNKSKLVTSPKAIDDRLWKQFGVYFDAKRFNINIYHGLANELPFFLPKKVKSIITIHDLLFLDYPQHYKAKHRKYYNFKFKHGALSSDKVIAVSTKSKNDLIKHYQINAEKIEVVLQGCNPVFKKFYDEEEKEAIKEKYNLPNKFILFVGSIQERKNLLPVLQALKGTNVPFVIISNRNTKYLDRILSFIKNERMSNVFFRQVKSNKELAIVYQMSQSLIFPSLNEGFGIPIIEALSGRVPVIANDIDVFKEVGADYCYYVQMDDTIKLKRIIEQVWEERKIPNEEHLSDYMMKFSDKSILDQYSRIYKNL